MGTILDASCGACGHNARVRQGRGFASDVLHEPAICHACGGLQTANVATVLPSCMKCGAEDVTLMADLRAPEETPSQTRDEALRRVDAAGFGRPGGRYQCPSCGRPELRFYWVGMWD